MILRLCKSLCCLTLLLVMIACVAHVKPSEDLSETTRKNFIQAMRMGQFKSAAAFIHTDQRADFMAIFKPLKDLHVTDVKLTDLQPRADDSGFDTTIEIEYYMLPSVSMKTFSFDQRWEFFSGEHEMHQGYFVVTPFPEFP